MRRLLARLALRGRSDTTSEGSDESSQDEETEAMIADINHSDSVKPMVIATNMQLPIYSNENLKPDSALKYYCTNELHYSETSHMYAALVGNEIYYFPSDYTGTLSTKKQLLCCKLSSNRKIETSKEDKAADHDDYHVTSEIFNAPYDCKEGVTQENNVLFRSLCTDEKNNKIYVYGGSIFTWERSPTNNFHVFHTDSRTYERINMENSAELPQLEGHTMIKRDADTLYIFGGLLNKVFCNKLFEMNIKTRKWREITAVNHDLVKERSYHVCQYISKYDAMVIVSGKLRVGPSAPMTNEILIYHFKENRFQIVNNPTPFFSIPAHHVIHSCVVSENQLAFYGGCKTTNYNTDEDYDSNLFVFTFNKTYKHKKHCTDLTPVVSAFDLQERTSSCYTTLVYHKKFKCFVMFGANAAQRKDNFSFFYLDVTSYKGPLDSLVNLKLLKFDDRTKFHDISLQCTH